MNIRDFIMKEKRNFNMTIYLTGVIPFLVFIYLLSVKISSFRIFIGEVGYIMLTTAVVFAMGVAVGRKMILSILNELVERNRLAAITETTLALSHEINNPLVAVRGNIELMEMEISESRMPDNIRNRLGTIKNNCEKIRAVTEKMSSLSKPAIETIHGDVKMVNLGQSQ